MKRYWFLKHSRYRYFDQLKWAEAFMDGHLMFRSLSHYLQIEDGEVRGDPNEGSVTLKPETGLVLHHQRLGKSFTFSGGAFASSVNTEEMFVLCASSSIGDELRDRFQAKALVEIRKVATFCARIEAALPPSTTFRAQPVHYYSPAGELGAKWAFPDMIAFSKVDGFAWQDKYRFCFSITDALKYGQTKQHVMIPNQPSGAAAPPLPPAPREYPLSIKAIDDICELHKF